MINCTKFRVKGFSSVCGIGPTSTRVAQTTAPVAAAENGVKKKKFRFIPFGRKHKGLSAATESLLRRQNQH
jgi:hypothetical protein